MTKRWSSNRAKAFYIKQQVANYYGVDIDTKSRAHEFVRPRQMAMLLCRRFTALSYPQIASIFNMKDHTTVIHNVQVMTELITEKYMFNYDYMCFASHFKEPS